VGLRKNQRHGVSLLPAIQAAVQVRIIVIVVIVIVIVIVVVVDLYPRV
jgi:hypothetical protein